MRRGGTWRELFRQFCNVQIITLDMIREDKNFMMVSSVCTSGRDTQFYIEIKGQLKVEFNKKLKNNK